MNNLNIYKQVDDIFLHQLINSMKNDLIHYTLRKICGSNEEYIFASPNNIWLLIIDVRL